MELKSSKKIAIIGAGVIGLYLAWKLSKAGHKVTVFEKNEKVGQKPCSGLISERIKNFVPFNGSIIENKINSCLIHFSGKDIELRFKPVSFAIKRQKLDKHLYNLAQESEVKILLSHPIEEIPSGFDRVIGCDGSLSKVRELLSLPKPLFKLGLQVFLPIKDFSNQVEIWPIKQGFFWRIPRGKNIEYGLIGNPKTANQEFESLFFNVTGQNLITAGKKELALIPQALIIPDNRNVTLCGDAMGLTKPWSGGGVIWGLTAAEILLKYFPDFGKYHREVKKFFGLKILKGKLTTNLVYFLGNNFSWFLPSEISRDNDFPFL